MLFIVCFLIGLLSAIVGSIVGLGGGVILVPSLLVFAELTTMFKWVSPQSIVGISLIVMIFTASSSSISYFRKRRIDFKSSLVFICGSIPGGMVGSFSNQFVATDQFTRYFGLLMLLLFLTFFLKRKTKELNKHPKQSMVIHRKFKLADVDYTYSFSWISGFFIALFIGFLSGLFGIGGGSLLVPAMILLFRFPPHVATATSMFIILFSSTTSSITHIILGHIDWNYVWPFIPGAWIGGTIGAKVNQRLSGKHVEWMLRIILLIIGLRLIWQGLT